MKLTSQKSTPFTRVPIAVAKPADFTDAAKATAKQIAVMWEQQGVQHTHIEHIREKTMMFNEVGSRILIVPAYPVKPCKVTAPVVQQTMDESKPKPVKQAKVFYCPQCNGELRRGYCHECQLYPYGRW